MWILYEPVKHLLRWLPGIRGVKKLAKKCHLLTDELRNSLFDCVKQDMVSSADSVIFTTMTLESYVWVYKLMLNIRASVFQTNGTASWSLTADYLRKLELEGEKAKFDEDTLKDILASIHIGGCSSIHPVGDHTEGLSKVPRTLYVPPRVIIDLPRQNKCTNSQ